jgi:hypothetical protein
MRRGSELRSAPSPTNAERSSNALPDQLRWRILLIKPEHALLKTDRARRSDPDDPGRCNLNNPRKMKPRSPRAECCARHTGLRLWWTKQSTRSFRTIRSTWGT